MRPLHTPWTLARNVVRPFRARIFFQHIPKCGGTSVGRAIRAQYHRFDFRAERSVSQLDADAANRAATLRNGAAPTWNLADDRVFLKAREDLLLYELGRGANLYVGGHFPFSEHARREFGSEYAFLTMLRNPVDRWISSYLHRRRHPNPRFRVDSPPEAYLDSDFGRSQGRELVKYLGGRTEDRESPAAVLERAKRNLDEFAIVGVVERLDRFVEDFRERFGRSLPVGHLNRSPAPTDPGIFGPALRRRIEAVCQPDLEAYEFACERRV